MAVLVFESEKDVLTPQWLSENETLPIEGEDPSGPNPSDPFQEQ